MAGIKDPPPTPSGFKPAQPNTEDFLFMIQTTKDEIIYHFTVTLKTNASKHQKKTTREFYMFVCICHKSFLTLIVVNMHSSFNIQSVSSAKCADDNLDLVPCTALCSSEEDGPGTGRKFHPTSRCSICVQ